MEINPVTRHTPATIMDDLVCLIQVLPAIYRPATDVESPHKFYFSKASYVSVHMHVNYNYSF